MNKNIVIIASLGLPHLHSFHHLEASEQIELVHIDDLKKPELDTPFYNHKSLFEIINTRSMIDEYHTYSHFAERPNFINGKKLPKKNKNH